MVVSTSEEMPEPRVRNSASISSKKMTTGTSSAAFSRALTKISGKKGERIVYVRTLIKKDEDD